MAISPSVDCGQQYTVLDLYRIKKQAVIYVRGVLKSIENFTVSNGYAAS